MVDFLAETYPLLGRRLPKVPLADLPTPVTTHRLALPSGSFDVAVKHDEATSRLYGGNKVRKLELLKLDLADYKSRGFTKKHPDVVKTRAEIEELEAWVRHLGSDAVAGEKGNASFHGCSWKNGQLIEEIKYVGQ